jgi:hypothetical protein
MVHQKKRKHYRNQGIHKNITPLLYFDILTMDMYCVVLDMYTPCSYLVLWLLSQHFYRQVLEAKAALYEKMAKGEIEGTIIYHIHYYY